jgi:6-pyruvoyltetrahydropterin/6-carboxytetrahydropterin synthase
MFVSRYKASFSCALKLNDYPLPCGGIHGHRYELTVCFQCHKLNEAGISLDYMVLKQWLDPLVTQLDHRYLNQVPPFDTINPTTEHLARWFYEQLLPKFHAQPNVTLQAIELSEDDQFTVSYQPHDASHEATLTCE